MIWQPDAEEYRELREGVGLFERSERGKLALSGADAAEFLDSLLSNDIAALAPGSGCWATLLTHKGRMLAEVRVLRSEDEYLLDCERVALQALFDALNIGRIGHRVELHKRTLQRGLLSLLGPGSAGAAGVDPGEAEHECAAVEVRGVPVLCVRTWAGLDLICPGERTVELAALLGVRQVAEAAAECLRIEAGRPRFGVDMDETTMPQEAGLHERAVSYNKGCYVGQETVARLYWKGKPNRHLRLLKSDRPLQPGSELLRGETPAGHVSSSTVSPAGGPLALALVRREAEPGSELVAGTVRAIVRDLKSARAVAGA
ncbi:MAG: folate-binding protein YgfZ [Solirubrobacteraceae bacterium]